MIKSLAFALTICLFNAALLNSPAALAQGNQYVFEAPRFENTKDNAVSAHYAGQLKLNNGIQLPAYNITMPNSAIDEPYTTDTGDLNQPIDASINPVMANQVEAYAHPHGWILVPKGWKPYGAGYGANGSVSLLFAPDATGQRYLSYFDTSSCVGCALSAASVFFTSAQRMAQKDEFSYYDRTNVPVKKVQLRPTVMSFSYQLPDNRNHPIHGLALFDPDNEGSMYRKIEIRLHKKDQALASTLLNWFVPKKQ